MVWGTRLYHLQDPPLSESLPLSEPAFIFVPNAPVFMGLCQVRHSRALARTYQYPSPTRTGIGLVGDGRRPAPPWERAGRPPCIRRAEPNPPTRPEKATVRQTGSGSPTAWLDVDRIRPCRYPKKFSVVARAQPHVSGNRARGDLGIGSDRPIPPPLRPAGSTPRRGPPRRPIARPDPPNGIRSLARRASDRLDSTIGAARRPPSRPRPRGGRPTSAALADAAPRVQQDAPARRLPRAGQPPDSATAL